MSETEVAQDMGVTGVERDVRGPSGEGRLRICVATPLYPPDAGGPATYAKLLETYLPPKGIDVVLVKFNEVRHLPRGIRHARYMLNVLAAARTADVVLALDPVSTGLPACIAARIAGKPFVVKVVGDFAWEQGRQRYGVTSTLDDFVTEHTVSPMVWLLRAIQSFVAMRATTVIVPSEYLKRIVSTWDVSEKRVKVIHNAVLSETSGTVPKALAARSGLRIVWSSGRMVPWKGLDGVIEAVARVRRTHSVLCVFVGDGPERERLEEKARELLGEEGAFFTGVLSHADALAVLRTADVYVLNSSYEGLSHSLIEAAGAGVCIVATDAGGNGEVIIDGQNGLMVAPGDTEALADALEHLLTSEALRMRLAAAARTTAARFSISHMIDETASYISDMVAAAPALDTPARAAYEAPVALDRPYTALFISNEPNLFKQDSAVRARMREYAKAIGTLHILSRSPFPATLEEEHLFIYGIEAPRLLAPWLLMRRARALVRRHGIEVVSAQDPFEHAWAALGAVAGTDAKLHIQAHTDFLSPWFTRGHSGAALLNRVRVMIADRILPRAAGIRVVSERVKQSMITRYGNRIALPTVLPIAVPAEPPEPAAFPPHAFSFTLVTVSRLEVEKRVVDLLDALARVIKTHPQIGLFIVGDGRRRAFLEHRAYALGLRNNVQFLGYRSSTDAWGLMKSADVYVQASSYEGYGLTLMEAALAGTSIITTDVGIVGEVLRAEQDVLVVEPGNITLMADHIRRLAGDESLRATLAEHAAARARAHVMRAADQPARIAEDLARTFNQH